MSLQKNLGNQTPSKKDFNAESGKNAIKISKQMQIQTSLELLSL